MIARSGDLSRVTRGMEVVGADGQRVGQVKEARGDGILVERAALMPDVDVPAEAVRVVGAGRVALTVAADGIDDLWWAHVGEDTQVETKGQYD